MKRLMHLLAYCWHGGICGFLFAVTLWLATLPKLILDQIVLLLPGITDVDLKAHSFWLIGDTKVNAPWYFVLPYHLLTIIPTFAFFGWMCYRFYIPSVSRRNRKFRRFHLTVSWNQRNDS